MWDTAILDEDSPAAAGESRFSRPQPAPVRVHPQIELDELPVHLVPRGNSRSEVQGPPAAPTGNGGYPLLAVGGGGVPGGAEARKYHQAGGAAGGSGGAGAPVGDAAGGAPALVSSVPAIIRPSPVREHPAPAGDFIPRSFGEVYYSHGVRKATNEWMKNVVHKTIKDIRAAITEFRGRNLQFWVEQI